MTIHEFGKENEKIVVLIHPALVMWDYFEYVIPLMQDRYHLIIPALPGYDEDMPGDFTSVEKIAAALADWLTGKGITEISCIYGCSMGGAVAARFLADNRIVVQNAVMDGGITPYQFPWIVTRFIAIRDFVLIYIGKLGGIRLLEKAFTSDEYSEDDLKYIEKVNEKFGTTIIIITHNEQIRYMADRVIRVKDGKVVVNEENKEKISVENMEL